MSNYASFLMYKLLFGESVVIPDPPKQIIVIPSLNFVSHENTVVFTVSYVDGYTAEFRATTPVNKNNADNWRQLITDNPPATIPLFTDRWGSGLIEIGNKVTKFIVNVDKFCPNHGNVMICVPTDVALPILREFYTTYTKQ